MKNQEFDTRIPIRKKECISFKLMIILLTIAAAFLLQSCSKNDNQVKRYTSHMVGAFDTTITIIGYNQTEKDFEKYVNMADERFEELHQLFDRYNTYEGINNIKTINEIGAIEPVPVKKEIIDLLKISIEWQKESPNTVNIALGSVLELWHDSRADSINNIDQAYLPDISDLKKAAEHTNVDDIIIDEQNNTVFLQDSDLKLDLGAVAKGYATELVKQELLTAGWNSFIISSGGNVSVANPPLDENRNSWNIGIQNPAAELPETDDEILYTLAVNNTSVVTSGDYQRYYIVDGKRYHHIIDPSTLFPADYFSSITVVTPDSGLADFYSTVFFILPYEQGREYADSLEDVEVIWVFNDLSVQMTDGITELLK